MVESISRQIEGLDILLIDVLKTVLPLIGGHILKFLEPGVWDSNSMVLAMSSLALASKYPSTVIRH
ncbi:hypothetical protein [Methanomethylophilus alvi]|uniref:hypothetical protein n=1 Tax=Methanomethylophilus alvi TaxID=1291540 RepID=UPI0037DC5F53